MLFACTSVILIHVVASFFPEERLWGVNQLAYVAPIPRWIITILAFLILAPRINRILYDAFAGFFNLVGKNLKRINRSYRYFLFSLGSIIPFWLFKAKTCLLGDGHLRGSELVAGTKFSVTEPLDFYFHALAYRFLKLDAYQIYTLISCLAGALFVFLALWLSHLLGKENREKVLIFLVLVSMGSVQLFFGYVESYTLVYAGMMAYFLFSFLYLRGRCGLFFASLALLTSIGLHLSAVYLLPSLIYLYLVNPQREGKQFNFRTMLKVVFILLVVGVGFIILSNENPTPRSITTYLIPLAGNEGDTYSLFSGSHLTDVINEQLLLSPAGIILWVIVIFCARKINFKDRVVRFLAIVTLSSFVFAFILDPKLGYARDWDLFSSTGLGYTFLGVYLAFDYFGQARIRRLNYVILALASTALFSTLPWIHVNAREDKAVERFEALLDLDMKRSASGHEVLAYYYRDQGLVNEETEEWEKALSIVKSERYATNLGVSYLKLGRYQEAVVVFRMAVQLNPNSAENYDNLGIALFYDAKYDEAKGQYEASIQIDSSFFTAYINLGALYGKVGQYEDALRTIKRAIQINPGDFRAYAGLAMVYNRMGKPKEVIPFFQSYLKRNPKDHQRVRKFLKKMNIGLN